MTVQPRLLVVEGDTRDSRAILAAAGCRMSAEGYAETLAGLCAAAEIGILRPTDGETLPPGVGLADFDGICWTGSALNVWKDEPAVRVQVDLMRAAYASKTPIFGSCWGLQVGAVAAGGTVRPALHGREFGLARKIALTQAGRTHSLYAGKPGVFDALAIHSDEVERLPDGALVLAGNRHSAVQAAEIQYAGGVFWGVQYHPEFDLREIGLYARRYAPALTAEGFFAGTAEAEAFAETCAAAQATGRPSLRQALAIDDDVLDDGQRLRELANWLATLVRPRAAGRRARDA
jgi:GMP synthase (glutamine-hydrolysing)